VVKACARRAELLTLTVKSWTEVADEAAAMVERTARIDGAAAEIEASGLGTGEEQRVVGRRGSVETTKRGRLR
jgi:hypothetical protein